MLSFKNSNKFSTRQVFFADKPRLKNWYNTYYIQALSTKKYFFFKRIPKYTKLISLISEDYSDKFEKNTNYEIRRAVKEGISCETSTNIDEFILFYNNFTKDKGLNYKISNSEIDVYINSLILTYAKNDKEPLVYHSYLLDRKLKRVRLLHSASKIYNSNETNSEKALIGRANRLLHLKDMNYFEKNDFETYDFGGYAYNTNDRSLQGINNFKDSFGGELVEESIYESYPRFIIKIILTHIIKFIKK